jgi:hypothetical protein
VEAIREVLGKPASIFSFNGQVMICFGNWGTNLDRSDSPLACKKRILPAASLTRHSNAPDSKYRSRFSNFRWIVVFPCEVRRYLAASWRYLAWLPDRAPAMCKALPPRRPLALHGSQLFAAFWRSQRYQKPTCVLRFFVTAPPRGCHLDIQ